MKKSVVFQFYCCFNENLFAASRGLVSRHHLEAFYFNVLFTMCESMGGAEEREKEGRSSAKESS